jgi:hypothetical protein
MTAPLVGIVANARNCWPSRAEQSQLGAQAIRTIVYDNDSFDAVLSTVPEGCRVLALLNSEHDQVGHDYRGWATAVRAFAARFRGRVWAVEVTNEWDLLGIPAADVGRYVTLASDPLRDAGMRVILGSVAGPTWQQALIFARTMVDPSLFDYGSFHPYGQEVAALGSPQPGFGPGIRASIERAAALLGKPMIVTEFGAKLSDYGGEARQAQYVTEAFREIASLDESACVAACYFAWHDGVGSPGEQGENAFGLVRADGSRRPAFAAFQQAVPSAGNPGSDQAESYRQALLRTVAYVRGTPQKSIKRKKLLELLRA